MKININWRHPSGTHHVESFEVGKTYCRVLQGSIGDDHFIFEGVSVDYDSSTSKVTEEEK